MSVEKRLKEIVSASWDLKPEEITPQMRFVDYDDSMETVEIVIACEEEFGIDISDEEAYPIETFQQLVQLVEWKINSKSIA